MSLIRKVFSFFIGLSKIFSRKGIYTFLKKELELIEVDKKVLSVGSGGEINNLIRQYAKESNFHLTTFDISEDMNPDILGDICQYDFKDTKYDYIIIAEVLEHLHSPHLAVNNLNGILKSNGKIILTVPFIFPIHEKPYDYYRYTKYGLEFLFKDFDEINIKERNSWIEAINVLFVRLIMDKNTISRLFAPIFILLAFITYPLIYLMSKIIKTDFITTGYLLTAIKR